MITSPIDTENNSLFSEEAPLLTRKNSSKGVSVGNFGNHPRNKNQLPTSAEKALHRNFLWMSFAFSLNHGCVVSCLAYASAELGDELGGYGSGALYICFTATAFFFSQPIVSCIGSKNGLLFGLCGYCVYIFGFLLCLFFPSIGWTVFIPSASIGGIAGGVLWTAQGRYFARNSKQYCELTNFPINQVNSTFAGLFASSYLGLETLTKVIATVIFLVDDSTDDGVSSFKLSVGSPKLLVFSFYLVAAIVSCIILQSLHDLGDYGTWDMRCDIVSTNILAAAQIIYDDRRLLLMIPFQIAFGLTSSFVPYYVFGTVIAGSDCLGTTFLGLLSAIIVLTGSMIAMPLAWIANKFGKACVMIIGGICLTFVGFLFFVQSDAQIGSWAIIIPYLIIYGIGRGTWENTNKAVIADLYTAMPDHTTAAFAVISFANGLASALAYFTYPSIARLAMASFIVGFSLLAIVSYLGLVCLVASGAGGVRTSSNLLAKYSI